VTIDYAAPLALVRAERYTSPGEPSAILPDVYGDFTVGGIRGPIPAVLIDRASNTYGLATPMTSITHVYEEETDVTADATITLSTNYQGQGLITTISFASARSGQITVRGIGRVVDGDNPISQLEDLLAARASAQSRDYHTAALERARAACAALGLTTAWVVADDRPVDAWIAEIMLNVFGGWTRTGRGLLVLWVNDARWSESDLVAHIVAHRDCVDGDDDPEMEGAEDGLCNALTVYYLWSESIGGPSSRLTTPTDPRSINAYGEDRHSVTLRGHRDAGQVAAWAARFFALAAAPTRVEGAIVRFAARTPALLAATEGDLIGFSWDWGPTRERGHLYRNEVLRLLALSPTLDDRPRIDVVALDTGRFLATDAAFDAALAFDAARPFGGDRDLAER